MPLVNAKKSLVKTFSTPSNLRDIITIMSNCDLTEIEIDLFSEALYCVSKYLIDNNIDLSECGGLNILFTEDGSYSFVESNDSVFGEQCQFAIYNMKKLRQSNHEIIMLFVYTEELLHYFLRIYDETLIKYKVAEAIKYVIPDFNVNDMKGILQGL